MEEKNENLTVELAQGGVLTVLQGRFSELDALRADIGDARKRAEETMENAERVKQGKTGIFHRQRTLSQVRDVTADLAERQVESAAIQQKLLTYQQKQTATMKYLLDLGVSNLSNTRTILSFLRDKLENPVGRAYDEAEAEEIRSVIRQLQAQEDIFEKQERLAERVTALEEGADRRDGDLAALRSFTVEKLAALEAAKEEQEQEIGRLKNNLTALRYAFGKKTKRLLILTAAFALLALAALLLALFR